jgi:putative spermidine/putrescine transport system ATP-binding protein
MVHLAEYAERYPRQLSGGQRQRVALARGIVFDPPLLLMDEPLGALDLKLREQMQGEIKRLHREIGCTVLYVTHDQGEAMSLSDRIVIMHRGRIVQTGTPEQIYDRPNSRFAAEFVGETNILPLPADVPEGAAITPELVRASLAAPSAADRPWALSVRPDAWRRVPAMTGGGDEVVLPGQVEQVQFLGDVVRYAVRVGPDRSLTVKEPRRLGAASAAVGERVNIAVACRDMVLVRDEAVRDTAAG